MTVKDANKILKDYEYCLLEGLTNLKNFMENNFSCLKVNFKNIKEKHENNKRNKMPEMRALS